MSEPDIRSEPDSQKALIYCRISSIKQRVEGSGLESQRHRCESYAQAQGYFVEQVFTDDVSGGGDFMKRPGMVALLSYLKRNRKTNYVVIFDDLKRFARHTMSHLSLRDELLSVGARVECLNYRFEETPEARFVETIHAAQGQLEREQTGRQTVQKMRARLEQGYFVFHAPVGYRYEKTREHGKLLVRDEPVASIIAEALNGFASGRFQAPVEVRRFLESFPEFPKRPDGKVLQQKVSDMLVHPVYAGCVAHERWGIGFRKGHHQPIITVETYKTNQERLLGRAKVPARKNLDQDFPLRGFILCDDCQRPLTSCWSKGKYPYYHCQKQGCDAYGKSIRRSDLHGEFETLLEELTPTPTLFKAAKLMFEDIWKFRVQYQQKRIKTLKAQAVEIERKIDALIDLAVDASSPSSRANYEKRMNVLERDRLVIAEKVAECGRPISDQSGTLRNALQFLENPCTLWASDRLENKRAVLKLVFAENLSWRLGKGLRTAKTTLPFKVLGASMGSKIQMVPRRGLEPPRPCEH